MGAAAAMANLDILLGEDLIGNAARTGAYMQAALRERVAGLPLVGDVRGVGLVAGIQLMADRASRRPFDATQKVSQQVAARCLDDGLIVRAPGGARRRALAAALHHAGAGGSGGRRGREGDSRRR